LEARVTWESEDDFSALTLEGAGEGSDDIAEATDLCPRCDLSSDHQDAEGLLLWQGGFLSARDVGCFGYVESKPAKGLQALAMLRGFRERFAPFCGAL
jgi:hypothetical protein